MVEERGADLHGRCIAAGSVSGAVFDTKTASSKPGYPGGLTEEAGITMCHLSVNWKCAHMIDFEATGYSEMWAPPVCLEAWSTAACSLLFNGKVPQCDVCAIVSGSMKPPCCDGAKIPSHVSMAGVLFLTTRGCTFVLEVCSTVSAAETEKCCSVSSDAPGALCLTKTHS